MAPPLPPWEKNRHRYFVLLTLLLTSVTLLCLLYLNKQLPQTNYVSAVPHSDWSSLPLRLSNVLDPRVPLAPLRPRLLISGWLETVRRWEALLVSGSKKPQHYIFIVQTSVSESGSGMTQ